MTELEKKYYKKLIDAGFRCNIKGFKYLLYALIYIHNNPESLSNVTKEVYPEVAENFKTSCSNTINNLRYAVRQSKDERINKLKTHQAIAVLMFI